MQAPFSFHLLVGIIYLILVYIYFSLKCMLYNINLLNNITSQVFMEYFKEMEEESIRDNFVIIYELMDELMDFGYPQFTESKILQEYGHSHFLQYSAI